MKTAYRIGLSKLRRKQGLLSTLDPKYIKRDHKPRLEELKAKGFLRDFRFEKGSDHDDPWQIWVLKNPTFGLRRATREQSGTEPAKAPESAPESSSATNSALQEADPIGPTADLVGYFHERFHGTDRSAPSKSEIAKAAELLSRCAGDLAKAKHCIDWTRNEAGRTNFAMQHFSALLLNGYPERALANLEAERARVAAARNRQDEAEMKDVYNTWLRQEVARRQGGLDPGEHQRMVAEALVELRAGRTGLTFSKIPEQMQRRIAESKVRRRLGRDLPSFDEWLVSRRPGSSISPPV